MEREFDSTFQRRYANNPLDGIRTRHLASHSPFILFPPLLHSYSSVSIVFYIEKHLLVLQWPSISAFDVSIGDHPLFDLSMVSSPSIIIQQALILIGSPPSSLPITRPNSAAGFSSRPSNKARKARSRSRDRVNAHEHQDQSQGSISNLTDILNSSTRPPSPTCAMYLPAQEVHICPVNDCDCRKSLGPIRRSSQIPQRIADLRIILLCTSINSFTQLCYARLKERASPLGDVAIKIFYPGTKCTNGTSDLIDELVEFNTDIILCPFLTAKIPAELYKKVSHYSPFHHLLQS